MSDLVTNDNSGNKQVASARKRFSEAIEKKDVYYAEIGPDIQELELKGSIMNTPPKDLVELEKYREWVKRSKSLKKMAGDYRLGTTRPLDELVTSLIDEHRQLFSKLDVLEAEITKQAMVFVAEEKKKEDDAKAKAENEKNKDIEIKSLQLKIKNSAIFALTEEIANIRRQFSMSWASLTLEGFDNRISILKGYMPKIDMSKLLPLYFNYAYSYITPDEFEGLLRSNFDFADFTTKLANAVVEIKDTYIKQAPEKKVQLQQQSESQRQSLITQAQNDEIQKGVQQELAKQQAEQQLKVEQANIVLEAESNVVQIKGTAIKNVRKNQVAYISGEVDWNQIINIWLSENGVDKLQFLLTNLAKKGCPEIQGIAYKEDSKLIFK